MDTIGVKKFDDKGKVIGERLFVGLFTSVAYSRARGISRCCGARCGRAEARRLRLAQP